MGSQGMEMKLYASLIILLTCQVLHSTGEPSPDPQDVNLYLFLPNENEGKGGQKAASVESEKGGKWTPKPWPTTWTPKPWPTTKPWGKHPWHTTPSPWGGGPPPNWG